MALHTAALARAGTGFPDLWDGPYVHRGAPHTVDPGASPSMVKVYQYLLEGELTWFVMLSPDATLEEAWKACRLKFGDKLVEVRPYKVKVSNAKSEAGS